MKNFIYVFSHHDRDVLVSRHYNLLKSDDTNEIYVFEDSDNERFDLSGVEFVQSDVLTF